MNSLRDAIAAFSAGDEEARREAVARLEIARGAGDTAEALAFLVEAMGDASWRVRKEAAARAADWDDRERAAEALVAALAEPDNVGRRNAAVEGLVTLGAPAVPPLIAALAGRPEHAKLLVDTLGLIADPRGGASVAPLVDDADPNVRVAAAEALGRIGGADAIAALRRALERRERLLQLAALDGLGRAGAHLGVDELAPLCLEPTLRAAALEALGRSGDRAAAGPLAAALTDAARSTREAATRALAQLATSVEGTLEVSIDEAALPPLTAVLLDGAAAVRRAAATLLGLSGHKDAVRPLALSLGEPELRAAASGALVALGAVAVQELVALAPDLDPRLRADVFQILARLHAAVQDRPARVLLEESLRDEDSDAAAAAAETLGVLGDKESLPSLVRALERERPVAAAAAGALGRLGRRFYDEVRMLVQSRGLSGPDAPYLCRVLGVCGREGDAALLRSALQADAPALRRAAAEALGELRAADDVDEALVFALADESPEVRAAAARALGAHARASALGPLERAAHDPEAPVRAAAAHALGGIAQKTEGEMRAGALTSVRRLADSADAVLAAPALEALGEAGEAGDEPRLVAALGRPDEEAVKAAARALGRRWWRRWPTVAGTCGARRPRRSACRGRRRTLRSTRGARSKKIRWCWRRSTPRWRARWTHDRGRLSAMITAGGSRP
jgi:HEAT repeat protein